MNEAPGEIRGPSLSIAFHSGGNNSSSIAIQAITEVPTVERVDSSHIGWSMSEPMWLIVVSSVDPMVMGEIQDWVAGRQDTASAMFDFPDLPVSGDLDFRVLFLTPSKETATLFKTFYA